LGSGPEGGSIYLTFDDFPAERSNDQLLDQLRRLGVKATFFCICSKLTRFEEVTHRAISEGHELEIHGWEHDRSGNISASIAELKQFGYSPSFSRPPGTSDISTLTGERLAIRNIDPYDYKRPSKEEILRRALYGIRPGKNVIQLHAGVQVTVDALPALVSSLKARGYRFELLRSHTHQDDSGK
jgi:peptidoglycan/xylan/chitin deacetylase (PgdA/CDA1 family)